jgi:general secretion pathway protein M
MMDSAFSAGGAKNNPLALRLQAALAPLRARWAVLAPRERRLVAIAGWMLGAAVLWFALVAPPLKVVRAAPARLDALDAQIQEMQRAAAEARGLRALPSVGAAQAQAAVKAATDGLDGSARLQLSGERATITFTNTAGHDFQDWLGEVRGAGRARVIDAKLTRGAQGFSGTVVLQLPGGGAP